MQKENPYENLSHVEIVKKEYVFAQQMYLEYKTWFEEEYRTPNGMGKSSDPTTIAFMKYLKACRNFWNSNMKWLMVHRSWIDVHYPGQSNAICRHKDWLKHLENMPSHPYIGDYVITDGNQTSQGEGSPAKRSDP